MFRFHLHLKILSDPSIPIAEMLDDMRLAFAPAEIDFVHLTSEDLALPHLTDLDVGACAGTSLTAEQRSLYSLRDGVSDDELAVYFVRSTDPFIEGCAAFEDERRPSAAVIALCSRWALAHEVGHILGLDHVSEVGRLMHSQPPSSATIPTLSAEEIATLQQSRYLYPV